jgi:thioredoxin 1
MKVKSILVIIIILFMITFSSCGQSFNPPLQDVEPAEDNQPVAAEPAKSEQDTSEAKEEKPQAGGSEIKVSEADFEENVLNASGVILVDFWAEWCGPCLQLAPILEQVSIETGVTIAKVNVDENNNLASQYKISAIPAVFVFVDGEEKQQIIGTNPKQVYLDIIKKYE